MRLNSEKRQHLIQHFAVLGSHTNDGRKVARIEFRQYRSQFDRFWSCAEDGENFHSALATCDVKLYTPSRSAGVAELVDATDLKSVGATLRAGSSPALGTISDTKKP